MPAVPEQDRHTSRSLVGVASALLGLALFAFTIHETGPAPILEGIGRVGAGILAILLLSGLRFWVRARAWVLCTDPGDRGEPLRVRDTFPALLAGDALGNLTPLGLFVSEPTKAAFVRHRVTLMSAVSGVTVENIFYTLSVAVVIASGTAALLFLFDVPGALRQASLVALGLVLLAVVLGMAVLVLQIRVVSRAVSWMHRREIGPMPLRSRIAKLEALEASVYGFTGRHPSRVPPILALQASFHALGVAEIWLTMWLLAGGAGPTLLTAFVLETVNRTIMVVFKFVPLRLGVDEAGTELLTRTLGLATGIGVTLAIVRKVRMLCWSAVGVAFLVRRGLHKRPLAGTAPVGRPQDS
jgi:hypothetical protein